jgi:cation diffusion facilitator family transporter
MAMTEAYQSHDHVFLGAGHAQAERRTWMVIGLCTVMMIAEIIGGLLFGSIALVADGLHMSTHASALLLTALAYNYARRHARDARFSFGTGKLGDLAGFASAIILAMIALLIGYEAVLRFIAPVPIRFDEAILIAVVGLIATITGTVTATAITIIPTTHMRQRPMRPIATTICGPPSSTCWGTPAFHC